MNFSSQGSSVVLHFSSFINYSADHEYVGTKVKEFVYSCYGDQLNYDTDFIQVGKISVLSKV